MKRILSLIAIVLMLFPAYAFAHSGGTDANGGHHDYNNVSGLGDYHYHHGYGPHLHDGGVCPYETNSSQDSETITYISETSGSDYIHIDDFHSEAIEYALNEGYMSPEDFESELIDERARMDEQIEHYKSSAKSSDRYFTILFIISVLICSYLGWQLHKTSKELETALSKIHELEERLKQIKI